MRNKRTRFALLDTLRGMMLVSMILYHGCWNLVYLYGKDWQWYRYSKGAYFWQKSICCTFIFLSGFCLVNAAIAVETMITPPVTKGYCTDAGNTASEIRSKKLATRLRIPPPALKRIARKLGVLTLVPIITQATRLMAADMTATQSE